MHSHQVNIRGVIVVRISHLISASAVAFFLYGNAISAAEDHFHPKGKSPSNYTIEILEQARSSMNFSDTRDFDEQAKGFIAAPTSMQIMADVGHVAWDIERYQFLAEGKEFDSIHPSLQRQAELNLNFGLYEVLEDKIYQVRGFDLSNITFAKGES